MSSGNPLCSADSEKSPGREISSGAGCVSNTATTDFASNADWALLNGGVMFAFLLVAFGFHIVSPLFALPITACAMTRIPVFTPLTRCVKVASGSWLS
jgi:hypothetical protein